MNRKGFSGMERAESGHAPASFTSLASFVEELERKGRAKATGLRD
jgi:hypothetical protein